MEVGRTKNAVRNTFWGILQRLVMQFMPFVTRTIIIYILGIEYAGLSSLFTSVLVVLSFAELGFSNAIVYLMYKPMAENNYQEICSLLNLYRTIYRYVGAVILIIGISLYPFLPYIIKGECPKEINIYILYTIYLLNTVLSYFLFAYKRAILYASQRRDIESKITIVVMFITYLAEIILLFTTKNYYFYTICLPISTITINLLIQHTTKKKYPWGICYGKVSIDIVNQIKRKIIALFGHKLGYTVRNTISSLLISYYIGLTMVGIFNNYYLIVNAITILIGVFYHSILPSIGNSAIKKDLIDNFSDFKNLSFLNYWINGVCVIGFVCILQPFMKLWLGEKYLLSYVSVLLMSINFYLFQIRYIVIIYKDAIGLWGVDALKPYVELIVNIILGTFLTMRIGVNGAIIAAIAANLIGLPWETSALFKHFFRRSTSVFYKQLIAMTLSIFILGVGCCFISKHIQFNNMFLDVCINILITLLLPNILLYLYFRKSDEIAYFKERLLNKNLLK